MGSNNKQPSAASINSLKSAAKSVVYAEKWASKWKQWCDGDDPVLQSAIREALRQLGKWSGEDYDAEALKLFFDRMDKVFQETKKWECVKETAGGDLATLDSVDHLMAIWFARRQIDFDIPLETALMFLTLREANAQRPGVALKAFYVGRSKTLKEVNEELQEEKEELRKEKEVFREGYDQWMKLIPGRKKGGEKSGEAKREENAPRDQKMRDEAVKRLKNGDVKSKIVSDFSERHGIGKRRVNQILEKDERWPSRSKKRKRNHT